ncbi:hypothetical protein A6M13_11730 [Caryophanon tenue]|uniref:Uncharacterized protein n=1 Tax=Caryophanon tenue TaxID=33978 RepID=A0A1C0YIL8_9BACL|nr:hypothetical protein A6M13_11730 [Caryophanon tenue]
MDTSSNDEWTASLTERIGCLRVGDDESRKMRLGQNPISDENKCVEMTRICWCVPTQAATSAGKAMFFCDEVPQEHALLKEEHLPKTPRPVARQM